MHHFKKFTIIGIALALLAFSAASVLAEDVKMPKVMNIIGHGVGSKLYGLAAGFSKVASTNLPTEFKVVPTSGPAEWVPMAWDGEVDLAVGIASDCTEAYYGKGFFEGKPSSNMRVLLRGGSQIIGNLTQGDSGIETLAQAKGKRYVLFSAGAGFTQQSKAFLANAGMSEKDVVVVTVPGPKDGARALIEGRADVTGTSETTMAEIAELEASSRGARFLSMDNSPEAVKRFLDVYPVGEPVLMEPGPGLRGIKKPTWMWSFDWYLLGSANIKDDVIYKILGMFWEHDKELAPLHPGLKTTKHEQFFTSSITFPYHDGAVKFYKDKGVWTDDATKKQTELVAKGKKQLLT